MFESLCQGQSSSKLLAPAPPRVVIEQALQAAFTVPDHGAIRPANYIVCENEGLNRLGDIFERVAISENMTQRTIERASAMPLRAPMVIIASCKYQQHAKVPAIEQAESVACSVYAMQLVFEDAGYSSMWRTGTFAHSPGVKQALDLAADDEIIGFLYIGKADSSGASRRPYADYQKHVSFWS